VLVAAGLVAGGYGAGSAEDAAPQKKYRIGLLHMYDGMHFFQEMGSTTYSNKARYAARHGYDMIVHSPRTTSGILKAVGCDGDDYDRKVDGECYKDDPTFRIDKRAATFGKIKLAMAACVGRKDYWLLWSDADALIVNQSIALHDIIDDRYDIMITADWLMINAGVMLLKCSEWNVDFLSRVYDAREFDKARALDQSAFDHFFAEEEAKKRIKHIPKWVMNTYTEEYRPGDFLVHCAGKLYEATEEGAVAIVRQLNALSQVDDIKDIEAFFSTRYLLNAYSGTCVVTDQSKLHCDPDDERRLRLPSSLGSISAPNRYKHVGLRYQWLQDWTDKHDLPDWNADRVPPTPMPPLDACPANDNTEL